MIGGLFAIFMICSVFAGCTGFSVNEKELLTEYAERLADALNEKDENKLNALFIPNVINESPSFTEDVKELFELYEGPFKKISKVQLRSSGDSVDSGMRTSYTSGVFTILAGGERYYCYMRAYYRNDVNPENVGIEYLRVYSREAKVTSTTKNKKQGLDVSEGNSGEFETVRIYSDEYEYNYVDRKITEKD